MKPQTENEPKGGIVVDSERCKGCGLCADACKKRVIEMADGCVNQHGYPYAVAVQEALCTGCAACGIVCPDGCITVYRRQHKTTQIASTSTATIQEIEGHPATQKPHQP